MRHLLDTNAWIHYFKQPMGTLGLKMASLPLADRYSCSVVLAELVTGNVREFSRVPGLTVEDWTTGSV